MSRAFSGSPKYSRRSGRRFFPQILAGKAPGEPVRIWVPGCSTGEEVYSIAICLLEYLGDRASDTPIQIFATDISDAAIGKARAGIYPEEEMQEVSPERRRRFLHPDRMEIMQSTWPSASCACLPATT